MFLSVQIVVGLLEATKKNCKARIKNFQTDSIRIKIAEESRATQFNEKSKLNKK